MADPTAASIAKSVLIATVNKGLLAVSAWAVGQGVLDEGTLSAGELTILAAGIAGLLISTGLTIFTRIRTWYLVESARKAAPGELMSVIKAEAKSNSPI